MTQFSEKTDKIIIEDINEIKNLAKKIIVLCDRCLKMMKGPYIAHDEWSNITTEIIRCYNCIEWIMEIKRGRF